MSGISEYLGIIGGGAGLGKIGAAQSYKGPKPQTPLSGGYHIILSLSPHASCQDFLILVLIIFHVMPSSEAISDGEYRLTAPAFPECIVAGVEDLI